jgi:uncharacterized membrane protein YcaP (DUF421 family)
MTPFDPARMLLDDFPLAFLGEVAVRALFAYVAVFTFLKISGRRGVRQLSLFEVVVILTLGSAAGDVSFYDDVPLLPVLTVFASLLLLYRMTTFCMSRFPSFGAWMEGKPVVIIRDGVYDLPSLRSKNISYDEFFMELRQQGVEHLGQVRLGILEVNGDVSLFFFDGSDVRPGLSVMPEELRTVQRQAPHEGDYACSRCGSVRRLSQASRASCDNCGNHTWSPALRSPRCR